MDQYEFRHLFLGDIKLLVDEQKYSDEEALVKTVADMLSDAEELQDYIPCYYEGIGKRGKKIKINGFCYDDLDNILFLFVCAPMSFGEIETISSAELDKCFGRAAAFVEESDFIVSNGEESSEGYGLAYDITHRLSKSIDKIKIVIITEKQMSGSGKIIQTPDINGISTELQVWDIGRIFQLNQSKNGKEDIVIKLEDFIGEGIPCLKASYTEDYTAYLCNVPGIVLAKLYNRYGGRLLEGNVRSFLQIKGKVNKGIRNTILNNPEKFFAFNNGIAATASNIKVKNVNGVDRIEEITALQIVNGGQTTVSLAMSYLNDKKDGSEQQIEKIYVPMKLSIVTAESAQELIPNISRYANTQNKVSDSDLWSNHPFHIHMEDISRKNVAPATDGKQYGTYWYYERANGQYKQETYKGSQSDKKQFEMKYPLTQMFKKEDLAKYWNILNLHPDTASAGRQKSFESFAKYITNLWEKDSSIFNKGFFEEIVAVAIIYREADKIVRRQEWFNSYKANIVAYTMSAIFNCVGTLNDDRMVPLHTIWLKQKISDSFAEQIKVTSKEIYSVLISDDRAVENVTEWAKREACWERVRKLNLRFSEDFINELSYKEDITIKKKDDRKDQKETNKVNLLNEIYNYGTENWKFLLAWNESHKVLNIKEIDFVKTAIKIEKGQIPSDAQCSKIMEALNKAREESFPK